MITDDLSVLFSGGGSGMSLRQGQIIAWDTDTGENRIRLGGVVLENVALLIAEATALAPGDAVMILSTGDSAFLLGKVTAPGEPGTVPTWTVDITDLSDVAIPAVQAQAAAAQSTADSAQSTATTAQSNAAAAQAAADLAAVNAAAAQAAADAAQAAADALDAALAAVAGDVDTLTDTTLPALAADLSTAQTEITTAQADIAAAQSGLDTLTGTTLPAVAADVAAAQADVDALTGTTLPALQTQVDGILPIGSTDITDDAITTPKIAAGAVTAAEIDSGAVTTAKLAAGAVTTNELAAGAVTAVKIAADTITSAQIAADAVTAAELAADAVTAGKIAAGTIVAADIAADAITTAKIAAGAVTAAEIAAGTITAAEIAAGAITGTRLSADAIDGKTITGALFRTAATGQRVEIDSAAGNRVVFYSGAAGESFPGFVSGSSPSSGVGRTTIASPTFSGLMAELRLESGSGPAASLLASGGILLDSSGTVTINAASLDLEASSSSGPEVRDNGDLLATLTRTQTLTNKTLTSPVLNSADLNGTTQFGGGDGVNVLKFANLTATPNASGQIVVTHGLGGTPGAVLLGVQTSNRQIRVQASSSTTFTIECRTVDTGVVVTTSMSLYWLAVR